MFWNSLRSTLCSVWETMHIHSHVMEVGERRAKLTKQLFPSGHVKRGHCRYGCSRQRHVCSSMLFTWSRKRIVSYIILYRKRAWILHAFIFSDRKERDFFYSKKRRKRKKEISILQIYSISFACLLFQGKILFYRKWN